MELSIDEFARWYNYAMIRDMQQAELLSLPIKSAIQTPLGRPGGNVTREVW
jgi:hypothetical protein